MFVSFFYSASDLIRKNGNTIVLNSCTGNAAKAAGYFQTRRSHADEHALDFRDIDIDDNTVVAELCKKIVSYGIFRHVGFTRTDGVTVNHDGIAMNNSHRSFIKDALDGRATIVVNTTCDFTGMASDMYTVPVRNIEGEIIGALTCETSRFNDIDLDYIDVSGKRNCYFMVDTRGTILYTPLDNTIGASLGDKLPSLISVRDEEAVKDIEYILNRTNEVSSLNVSIGGIDHTIAFSPISGTDWTFTAILPTRDIAAAYDNMLSLSGLLIIFIVALLILAVALLTLITKRLQNELGEVVIETMKSAYTDSVTGHESWGSFGEKYIAEMKNTSAGHAIISMDIDRFKAVNDSFGYEGGNSVLRQISGILERDTGKNDFFARSNGDLFYIMKEFTNSTELIEFCDGIISDIEYQIFETRLSMSIGIYIITDNNINVRAAADRADLARKTVKSMAESRYAFFDSSMIEKIRVEKYIENIMDDALQLGEFIVYLQPKFDLPGDKGIVGAEALVRWRHDDALVSPGDFIPLFEKNGFVMKLDYYMFEETCKLQKKWKNMGFEPKIVSVNMSRLHIHSKSFVEDLANMCEKYDIETKYLEIEITESAAYENLDILCDVFRKIKSYGFLVSIDDFGTGYSSLNMLKDLPVDVLKIDRSFLTEDADEEENASRIIGALVKLANSLGIRTICEGIETKEQANLLRKLGCDMAQGFYYSRPLPVSDYEKVTYGIEN